MSRTRGFLGRGGIIGGVQGGVSVANLQQVLETKGLTSTNLVSALKPAPAAPTSTPSTSSPTNNTPSKS